ncbi:rhomboid family intramembrane serine protease [Pelagicoccus mobilis]|uniref:Rhomboid family intramembrane serine protease n=1 Tax=Pelagicoccus mobilis TaxID=415221 RepID=A0A934S4W9_9BACT|nr:rhomboid family intramembrane serine protease [Pelagicoccus mobilis]MBK1879048.1 rhomboid family intramembrane serine protease [Pelagicoccus mobilis]
MYDRDYMSTNPDDRAKKTLSWLIGTNLVVFVLQGLFDRQGGPGIVDQFFAFRSGSLGSGLIWTPLTYSFLHGSFLHILFNMLMLFFFGRVAIQTLGQKRFLQLYFAAVLAGGLLWFAASFISGAGSVVGASAAVSALIIFFVCLNPDGEISLFGVLPLKARYLAYGMIVIAVVGFFAQEISTTSAAKVAHSAHMGGMLVGYLFYKYVYLKNPYDNSGTISLSFARFFKKKETAKSSAGYTYRVNVSKETRDLKGEVDRILDKINSKGFGSLSPKEKQILDEARDLLRKR